VFALVERVTDTATPLPWPQRILMTTDSSEGRWTYAMELSRAFTSFGIHVTLATMGPPRSARQRREADRVSGLEVYERPFKLEWMDDPWCDVVAAAQWLLELEMRLQPSLVHLNHFCHAAIGWSAPVLVVAHDCVLTWWDAVKGERAPSEWTRYRYEVEAGLRGASLIVTTTSAARRALAQYYTPVRSARLIPSGRDGRWFTPSAKDPVIVSMGQMDDEATNLGALADVAGLLAWPIDLLTPVDYYGVREGLSRASIFAWPAKHAPFATPVIDAALSGCALVLGDIPSLRETWHEAALFVPPDDHGALADALSTLIASPMRRQQLAHAARARALECSVSRMANGYLSAYCTLMAQRQATALAALR
jgi:glycogen(starch) synthase